MKVLVIDNYDSFVYNLVHYIKEFEPDVTVWRNDQFELEDVAGFDKIVLSPGPGIPEEAGLLKAVVERYGAEIPMLGVCLGQQAIGEVFGGNLLNLDDVFHGVGTQVERLVEDESLFKGLPKNFQVGRYHSWVVARKDFPADLEITAVDESGQIMALRHREYDLKGVQFHPESVLTPHGKSMIKNWLYEA